MVVKPKSPNGDNKSEKSDRQREKSLSRKKSRKTSAANDDALTAAVADALKRQRVRGRGTPSKRKSRINAKAATATAEIDNDPEKVSSTYKFRPRRSGQASFIDDGGEYSDLESSGSDLDSGSNISSGSEHELHGEGERAKSDFEEMQMVRSREKRALESLNGTQSASQDRSLSRSVSPVCQSEQSALKDLVVRFDAGGEAAPVPAPPQLAVDDADSVISGDESRGSSHAREAGIEGTSLDGVQVNIEKDVLETDAAETLEPELIASFSPTAEEQESVKESRIEPPRDESLGPSEAQSDFDAGQVEDGASDSHQVSATGSPKAPANEAPESASIDQESESAASNTLSADVNNDMKDDLSHVKSEKENSDEHVHSSVDDDIAQTREGDDDGSHGDHDMYDHEGSHDMLDDDDVDDEHVYEGAVDEQEVDHPAAEEDTERAVGNSDAHANPDKQEIDEVLEDSNTDADKVSPSPSPRAVCVVAAADVEMPTPREESAAADDPTSSSGRKRKRECDNFDAEALQEGDAEVDAKASAEVTPVALLADARVDAIAKALVSFVSNTEVNTSISLPPPPPPQLPKSSVPQDEIKEPPQKRAKTELLVNVDHVLSSPNESVSKSPPEVTPSQSHVSIPEILAKEDDSKGDEQYDNFEQTSLKPMVSPSGSHSLPISSNSGESDRDQPSTAPASADKLPNGEDLPPANTTNHSAVSDPTAPECKHSQSEKAVRAGTSPSDSSNTMLGEDQSPLLSEVPSPSTSDEKTQIDVPATTTSVSTSSASAALTTSDASITNTSAIQITPPSSNTVNIDTTSAPVASENTEDELVPTVSNKTEISVSPSRPMTNSESNEDVAPKRRRGRPASTTGTGGRPRKKKSPATDISNLRRSTRVARNSSQSASPAPTASASSSTSRRRSTSWSGSRGRGRSASGGGRPRKSGGAGGRPRKNSKGMSSPSSSPRPPKRGSGRPVSVR